MLFAVSNFLILMFIHWRWLVVHELTCQSGQWSHRFKFISVFIVTLILLYYYFRILCFAGMVLYIFVLIYSWVFVSSWSSSLITQLSLSTNLSLSPLNVASARVQTKLYPDVVTKTTLSVTGFPVLHTHNWRDSLFSLSMQEKHHRMYLDNLSIWKLNSIF